jgi:hypothetical protein
MDQILYGGIGVVVSNQLSTGASLRWTKKWLAVNSNEKALARFSVAPIDHDVKRLLLPSRNFPEIGAV